MTTLYTVNVVFDEYTFKGIQLYDQPGILIQTGNREIEEDVVRKYYKGYDKKSESEKASIRGYMDETFTGDEIEELVGSGYLKKFGTYNIREVNISEFINKVKEAYAKKGEEFTEEDEYPTLGGILELGVGGSEELYMEPHILNFPFGIYVDSMLGKQHRSA